MLKIFRKDSLTPQTERIYKVPLFHRLGSCLIPLDATERLRALHSYYRMGDEAYGINHLGRCTGRKD